MAAPPKPWEKGIVTSRSYNESINNQMSSLPGTVIPDNGSHPIAAASPRQPPPIPVRPSEQRTGGLSSYGGGLSSYGGYGGMSGYSGYGGYGGLGGGYGGLGGGYGGLGGGYGGYGGGGYGSRFDMQQNSYTPNSFVRTAEESSRQAFQSIESVVQAFGSVSMMLESTFYAVYNSFRAVIGVADQFTRMKMHFAQIFSAFAVIRTLKWIYRKLMVLIRLRKGGLEEDVWNEMSQASGSLTEADIKSSSRSSWPVLMFFAIVIGGPWLIWKLLSSLAGSKDENSWASGMSDHFVAVGEYDFDGDSEDELSFTAGQNIIVAPKELQPRLRGWLLASVDGKKVGIVPANYVKVLGKRRGRQSGNQTARGPRTTSSQPDLLRQTYSQTSLASNQPNSLEEAYSQPDPRLTQPYNQTSLSVNQPSYPDATFNQNDFSFNQSEQSTAGYNQDDPISNNADPLDVPTIQQNPQGFNPKSSPPNTASSSSTFQAESQSSLQSSPQDLQTTSGLPQSSIPNRDTTKKVHFISVQKPEESLDNKNVTERDDA